MTDRTPPWMVSVLLRLIELWNEPLAGDLREEYDQGRSGQWLWRQVLRAILTAPARHELPMSSPGVLFYEVSRTPESRAPLPLLDPATMNLSGIRVRGIGGLGLMAIVVLISVTMPAAWWLAAMGLAGGGVVGAILVLRRRNVGLSNSGDGGGPIHLFQHERPEPSPATRPVTDVHRSPRLAVTG